MFGTEAHKDLDIIAIHVFTKENIVMRSVSHAPASA
jgi:hypothetical protein